MPITGRKEYLYIAILSLSSYSPFTSAIKPCHPDTIHKNGHIILASGEYFDGDLKIDNFGLILIKDPHGAKHSFQMKTFNNDFEQKIEVPGCAYSITFERKFSYLNFTLSRSPSNNQPPSIPGLSLRMSGFINTRQLGSAELVHVENGASKTIGLEVGRTKEIQFSISEGSNQSVAAQLGANFSAFEAAIIGEIQSTREKLRTQGVGQDITSTYSVTVNGSVCNNWEISRYQTEEMAFVSAPEFGIAEEIPITVILSQRVEAVNLCQAQENNS